MRILAGENDVTVIFKSQASGRRWQHLTARDGQEAADGLPGVERNYTIILGSHRNTCIKVEKDGQLCDRVSRSCKATSVGILKRSQGRGGRRVEHLLCNLALRSLSGHSSVVWVITLS